MRQQLARIGVGPQRQVAFEDLPWPHKLAVLWGMKRGNDQLEAGLQHMGSSVNGWHVARPACSAADYKEDWLRRALVAKAGLYALNAEEATYLITCSPLTDGQQLDTGKHCYRLTFPAGQLPPARASVGDAV